ncbi:hypothetical protein PGUG_04666 [Meyerozyma guilliermondii ATCC 6260]|uniref:DNA repair protein REV1 n=1 Tax=Meyerozyma guilliermondii (strain ATCC 6260 / CBS 566 / DSM 6381 / JCM 1539 / NBRC 10279 / NRRL Y-324) TaxID=294746 RepID=A5DN15_PICGU|nr:uncharacterized protein PGUG_04666 [Meyerozyma guilliermondii ATCC 6260]EDK40568.2 hypothetical protein PGUG_04666 [Meyerozyma guilliermondii ATCC 6260]
MHTQDSQRSDDQYSQYLHSLDDEELLKHIKTLSQGITENERQLPAAQSTPSGPKIRSQVSNASSDPFDDGLDNVLQDISVPAPSPVPNPAPNGVHRNTVHSSPTKGDNEVEASAAIAASLESDSSSSEEEKYKPSEFGDYGSYFQKKRIKQQETDEAYVKWDRERRKIQGEESFNSEIFKGCAVHVNGHTEPSMAEIHRLVIIHGGTFIGYLLNKGVATHIVCDRLTPRKRIMFKNYRVVKAQWIVDCVAKGQLLPWEDYRLIDNVAYDQSRLSFAKVIREEEKVEEKEEESKNDKDDAEEDKFEEEAEEFEDEPSPLESQKEQDMQEASQESRKEYITYINERQRSDQKTTFDAKHPDFIEHFFSNSRLHHLSSWKADLRRQFLRRIIGTKQFTEHKGVKTGKSVILHVDFDSFFVTASCLSHPNLDIKKQPIAVSHGTKTSDVASCNYVARSFGIRNGEWVGRAMKKCPELIVIEYDFDAYERCSKELYNFLIDSKIFDSVFPVSIDEVLLDATTYCSNSFSDSTFEQRVHDLSKMIRERVYELTSCPVSVGASYNVLLAKLALRKAKPDGQFQLFDNVEQFLTDIKVNDLPGVGYSHSEKLQEIMNTSSIPTAGEVRQLSLTKLINVLGEKTGQKLYNYARGIDSTSINIDLTNKEAVLGRKSVSVDVNYGIRFDTVLQLDDFFMRLAKELYKRLISLGICGSQVTLKLAKRAAGAPVNPPKYLGMGRCDFVSKSSRLGIPTNDWGVVGSELKSLYRMSQVPVQDLRGIAVTMTRLEDVDSLAKSKQAQLPFYRSSDGPVEKQKTPVRKQSKETKVSREDVANLGIDWDVLQELPPEIRTEIESELNRRNLGSSRLNKARGKAYLQQLFPSQAGAPAPYIRTVEAKSSPKKRKTASKSPSPQKPREPVVFSENSSYDMSVLDQLPSSLQEEIKRDIEYKKKIKKYDTTSMRDKLMNVKRSIVKSIDDEWLSTRASLSTLPKFQGETLSVRTIMIKIKEWIEMSLEQQGPHRDDVELFMTFYKDLLAQNDIFRCLSIVKHIKLQLIKHQAKVNYEPNDFVEIGLNEWKSILQDKIIAAFKSHCEHNNLKVDNEYVT